MYLSNEPAPQDGVVGDLTTMADVVDAILDDKRDRMGRAMMKSLSADLRDAAEKVAKLERELARAREATAYWSAAAMSLEQPPAPPAPEPATNIVPFVWRKVA